MNKYGLNDTKRIKKSYTLYSFTPSEFSNVFVAQSDFGKKKSQKMYSLRPFLSFKYTLVLTFSLRNLFEWLENYKEFQLNWFNV